MIGPLMNGLFVSFNDGFSSSCDICALLNFTLFIVYLIHSIFATHDEATEYTDLLTTNGTSPMVSFRFNKELTTSTQSNEQINLADGRRMMSADLQQSKLTATKNQSMLFESLEHDAKIDFNDNSARF